jgi:hypothetical protein
MAKYDAGRWSLLSTKEGRDQSRCPRKPKIALDYEVGEKARLIGLGERPG